LILSNAVEDEVAIHMPPPNLVRERIRTIVVGCGGTGSAVTGALPYLHQALLAHGHPQALHVTVYDGDQVSEHNCARQPFARSEIGLHKSTVLVNRLNLFWGLGWDATPEHLGERHDLKEADLVIGCVDTRAARGIINTLTSERSGVSYWLDIGNNPESGQIVLGQATELPQPPQRCTIAYRRRTLSVDR
jgi:PRTRC genetic system ThiF family protein